MRFLMVAAFERSADSGAAGSLIAISDGLIHAGHEVDHLWQVNRAAVLPHPSLTRLFELPRWQLSQISEQLARERYDIVIVSQPYAFLAFEQLPARHPRTLFVNYTHGWEARHDDARRRFGWDMPERRAMRIPQRVAAGLTRRCCLRTVRACHGLVAPCSWCARYIERHYATPPGKVAVVPHGLDASYRDVTRAIVGPGTATRMLFVGSYIQRKGIALLESVLPELGRAYPRSTVSFVVDRDGTERVRHAFGPAFGDRLNVTGWVPRGDLPSIYARHDVLLNPTFFEGFGKTALEAMGTGACVVGSNEGGMIDVVRSDGEALLSDPGDVSTFRAHLERCLREPEYARGIGAKARERALQFTVERTCSELLRFCEQLRAQKNMGPES